MGFATLGVIALTVYLLVIIILGLYAKQKEIKKTVKEHYLADSKLGIFVLFFTLFATLYSGNSLIGFVGEAYFRGYIWVFSIPFMLGIVVVSHLFVPNLRKLAVKNNFITPGDWLRHRFYGEKYLKILITFIALLMLIALANFLLASLKAVGEMTELVTGGIVSYPVGIIGLTFVMLWYESVGGMRAVAWTDTMQGVLMLLGISSMLYWLYHSIGSLDNLNNNLVAINPKLTQMPNHETCIKWLTTILYITLASSIYPQTLQRVFAARSNKVLKQSFILISFMPLVAYTTVIFVGLVAITKISPEMVSNADQVLPLLLNSWATDGTFATFSAIVVFLGGLSAIMSTADSVLLSFGSIFTRDFLGNTDNSENATNLGKKIIILVTVLVATIALFRNITLWQLMELKLEFLVQCVPAIIFSSMFRKITAKSVFYGSLVGLSFIIVAIAFKVKFIFNIHVAIVSLLLNTLTIFCQNAMGKH